MTTELMKTYKGTKTINAVPMTRAVYNEFRGWTLPEDENGDDEGYLVEYVDGGKPNTTVYKGYVSWSPKEQFEKAYKEIVIRPSYIVGDLVAKTGGDYRFDGVVVAAFEKLSGVKRYVVEDDRGILHVYSDSNLIPRSAE